MEKKLRALKCVVVRPKWIKGHRYPIIEKKVNYNDIVFHRQDRILSNKDFVKISTRFCPENDLVSCVYKTNQIREKNFYYFIGFFAFESSFLTKISYF